MARIRSVHPGFFTDEDLVAVSAYARLFYLGLLTECDDGGVFEWKPTGLKIRILPNDAVDPSRLLDELVAARRVMRYEMSGRQYGAVRNFARYQRPKKPNFIHPNTPESRTWVGLTAPSSEPEEVEGPQVPPKEEKSSQMEEVGRRVGGGDKPKGAAAPPVSSSTDTAEKQLFDRAAEVLGRNGRSLCGKLLKSLGGQVALARSRIEEASTKSDPAQWLGAVLSGRAQRAAGGWDGTIN